MVYPDSYPLRALVQRVDPQLEDYLDGPEIYCSGYACYGVNHHATNKKCPIIK